MTDRSSELSLSFVVDKSKQAQSLAAIQALRAQTTQFAADIKKLSLTSSGLSNDMAKVSAKATEERNSMLKGTAAFKEQETVLQRLAKARAAANRAGNGDGGGLSSIAGGAGGDIRLAGKGLRVVNTLGNIAGDNLGLGQFSAVLRQSAPLIDAFGASVGEVAIAAPIAGAAVGAVAIAFKLAADQINKEKTQLDEILNAQEDYFHIIQTGTRDEVQQKLDAAKQKKEADEGALQAQLASAKQQRDNIPIFGALGVAILGLGDHIQKNKDAIVGDTAEINSLTLALNSNQVAANTATKAAQEFAGEFSKPQNLAAQIESIRATEKTAFDQMSKIRADEQAAEADILQKGADARIAIAQKEADNEAAALLSLQRANTDAQTKEQQQESDDKLNYQRAEAKAARDHANKLLEIRKDEQRSEVDLIASRSFAELAKARRDLNDKLDAQTDSDQQAKQDRLIALKEKLQDDKTGFVREQQQRQLNYQRQLSDLRAAETKEITAQRTAEAKSLEDTRNKAAAQLKIQQDSYQKMIQQDVELSSLRIALLNDEISAVRAMALDAQITGGGAQASGYGAAAQYIADHQNLTGTPGHVIPGAPRTVRRASGGSLMAGQLSTINERPGQIESFTSGGRSISLPYGMGTFFPAKSGRVNPGGGNVYMGDMHIHGATQSEIRRQAHKIVDTRLDEAFGAIYS